MKIPEDVKNKLSDGTCVICCNEFVVCMTNDYPRLNNASALFEIDREGKDIIFRHIIIDDPNNPLTVEYGVDVDFVKQISDKKELMILFVDTNFNEESRFRITFSNEEIKIMRKEIGLGT
ncbi:MAG: hypothetical protein QW550_04895 [Saccharolobus sp.]